MIMSLNEDHLEFAPQIRDAGHSSHLQASVSFPGNKFPGKTLCFQIVLIVNPDNPSAFWIWTDDEAFGVPSPQSDGYAHGLR